MRTIIVLAILIPVLMAGALFGLFIVWGDDLPTPRGPREVAPSMNTVVLDRDGRMIGEFFEQNRNPVLLQEVPEVVRQALLSTEDRRFYQHWGIDLWAIFRAFRSNLSKGGISQGGSTITQQLARNLFLTNNQTLQRKMKEAVLAVRLERSFSKDEIMELYLNQVYFGAGAYGIKAAADRYFGRSFQTLDLPEAALLIGIVANPSAYNPYRHPEAALARRNHVLRRMEQAGVIDPAAREAAESAEIQVGQREVATSAAPYFTEMVRQDLMRRYGVDEVLHGGLKVYTTIDLDFQRAAEKALEDQIREIENKHSLSYKYMRSPAQRMGGLPDTVSSTQYLQGALVAVEPQTGAIRALVGGRSFRESKFNRAVQARRQPGSSFKPFIYAAALESGMKTTDYVDDSPISFSWVGPGGRRQTWQPKNFSRKYSGAVTLRYALAKSINVPSIRLLEKVGSKRVIEMCHNMGIEGDLPPQLSLALGTGEVTPLEITGAYAALANYGIWKEPFAIEKVEDRYGRVLEVHQSKSREGVEEKASYQTISLMRSVLEGGTAWKAKKEYKFDAPAAGKTGTTDDYSDAWFVGCVPRLAAGVWVGFDEKKPIGSKMTGGAAALPAWCAFMNKVVEKYGKEDFVAPPGIVERMTCLTSGRTATAACPRQSKDAFAGAAPGGYCTIHGGAAVPDDQTAPETEPSIEPGEDEDE